MEKNTIQIEKKNYNILKIWGFVNILIGAFGFLFYIVLFFIGDFVKYDSFIAGVGFISFSFSIATGIYLFKRGKGGFLIKKTYSVELERTTNF